MGRKGKIIAKTSKIRIVETIRKIKKVKKIASKTNIKVNDGTLRAISIIFK
jgi:hypothetical protein